MWPSVDSWSPTRDPGCTNDGLGRTCRACDCPGGCQQDERESVETEWVRNGR